MFICRMYLEPLYKKQYFIDQLFPALLNVFVSIEISDETNNGDVVAFEVCICLVEEEGCSTFSNFSKSSTTVDQCTSSSSICALCQNINRR